MNNMGNNEDNLPKGGNAAWFHMLLYGELWKSAMRPPIRSRSKAESAALQYAA